MERSSIFAGECLMTYGQSFSSRILFAPLAQAIAVKL
jgi:hypothetical protein